MGNGNGNIIDDNDIIDNDGGIHSDDNGSVNGNDGMDGDLTGDGKQSGEDHDTAGIDVHNELFYDVGCVEEADGNDSGIAHAVSMLRKAGHRLRDKAVYRFHEGKSAVKGAVDRAAKGYDDARIFELGHNLLSDMAVRLREFAKTTHGCPVNYYDDGNGLAPRDEEWADDSIDGTVYFTNPGVFDNIVEGEELPSGGTLVHGPDVLGLVTVRENGKVYSRFLTNRDAGLDIAAWIEDILYAADTLEEYNKYDDILWYSHHVDLYGKETADVMRDEMESRFHKAWQWIGGNIGHMWD